MSIWSHPVIVPACCFVAGYGTACILILVSHVRDAGNVFVEREAIKNGRQKPVDLQKLLDKIAQQPPLT